MEPAAALDGNVVRTRRTRGRILAESLRLFNEHGEAHVSTGLVAESLGISPGNLHYHFRTREALVEALLARFEERMGIQPHAAGTTAEAIEELWLYLHLMLEGIWEFRFVYRALDDLAARNPRIRASLGRVLDRQRAAIRALCEALVRSGAMRTRPAELEALVENILVVSTHWLGFVALERRAPGSPDLGGAARQVMSMVAPHLAGGARRHFDRIIRGYAV